jgi:hypothetical protein
MRTCSLRKNNVATGALVGGIALALVAWSKASTYRRDAKAIEAMNPGVESLQRKYATRWTLIALAGAGIGVAGGLKACR